MKKIKQFLSLALAGLVAAVIYSGCKKGEDDPFLSLRSRKARVAGDWKVSKIEGKTSDTFSGSATNCTRNFDGSTYTETCGSGNPLVATGTWKFTFEKDGTFTEDLDFSETGDRTVEHYEGTWTFLSGIGDKKSKEQIAFTYTELSIDNTPSGATANSSMWTGKDRIYVVWDLKKLKSKEMVWYVKSSSSSDNVSTSGESTFTFTQE